METTETKPRAEAWLKVIRLGSGPSGDVFCKIKWTADARLSICGVEGPLPNGDARGGCGQISSHVMDSVTTWAPGWDTALGELFVKAWDRWHLNDMRAGCEHQREWDVSEKLTRYRWRRTRARSNAHDDAEAAALESARRGKAFTPTPEQVAALAMPYERWTEADECPEGYEPATALYPGAPGPSETKTAGWVRPDEHSRGLLTKPCGTCGYEYGSAWLREEVPADVLAFFRGLPETDKTPAWV